MNGNDQPRALSPDEVEILKKYRDLSMPAAQLAGLDEFAKWLFSSISVIGTLAAGFSTVAVKSFSTRSAVIFFIAISLTGLSLFLAVCLRTIQPKKANYQSLDDMLQKDGEALKWKQICAVGAGAIFALAVLVSGLSPLASVIFPTNPQSSLLYSYGKEGLKASASFKTAPHTESEMKLIAQKTSDKNTVESLLSAQTVSSGDDGFTKLELNVPTIPPAATVLKIDITCDKGKQTRQTIVLKLSVDAPPSVVDQTGGNGKGCVL
ncbi:MAG TPA: hypothetical protein VGD64_02005 [Acidisarcina sp.]